MNNFLTWLVGGLLFNKYSLKKQKEKQSAGGLVFH